MPQDSAKGSVNITGLPAGEYSVRVYDNSPATDSTSAAYQHSQLIHIMELTHPMSVSATSSYTVFSTGMFYYFYYVTPRAHRTLAARGHATLNTIV